MSPQAHVGREQVGERRPWAVPRCVNVKFLGVLQMRGIQAAGASPDLGPAAFGVQQQVLPGCSPVAEVRALATGGRCCPAGGS